jgi:hypothetical protein
MAPLIKITYTEWYAENKRCSPGTPGAEKRGRESEKWYVYWREGKKQFKVPLCADKTAAQAMTADLLRTKDRARSPADRLEVAGGSRSTPTERRVRPNQALHLTPAACRFPVTHWPLVRPVQASLMTRKVRQVQFNAHTGKNGSSRPRCKQHPGRAICAKRSRLD